VFLPTRLNYAGDLARKRQLAEADSAEHEFAHVPSRAAALLAAVAHTNAQYWRFLRPLDGELFISRDLCGSRHLQSCHPIVLLRDGCR
jgi:hypothetical protein